MLIEFVVAQYEVRDSMRREKCMSMQGMMSEDSKQNKRATPENANVSIENVRSSSF